MKDAVLQAKTVGEIVFNAISLGGFNNVTRLAVIGTPDPDFIEDGHRQDKPHQSSREQERRRRQLERARGKKDDTFTHAGVVDSRQIPPEILEARKGAEPYVVTRLVPRVRTVNETLTKRLQDYNTTRCRLCSRVDEDVCADCPCFVVGGGE